MKRRLDEIERKMNQAPALQIVDAVDWTNAPAEVLDAVERLEALAATLPPELSAAEKYGQIGMMDEGFSACKCVADWIAKRPSTTEKVCTE